MFLVLRARSVAVMTCTPVSTEYVLGRSVRMTIDQPTKEGTFDSMR